MTRTRKLKLWNGRWERGSHVFVAAHSIDDALELCKEAGHPVSRGEVTVYWSKNCWGTAMEGIVPERGIWIQVGRDAPVRAVPK